eukprot:7814676-Pyramimonas_sp.AAC.1
MGTLRRAQGAQGGGPGQGAARARGKGGAEHTHSRRGGQRDAEVGPTGRGPRGGAATNHGHLELLQPTETANNTITGQSDLERVLEETKAHVMMLQETR